MRKLILYYLYGILLIPIITKMMLGSVVHIAIHPSIVINIVILFLLLSYFIQKTFMGLEIGNGFFTKMFYRFFLVYLFNFFVVELFIFSDIPIDDSISMASKYFLLILLAFYIYENGEYFKSKVNRILIINSIVLLVNIIIGYTFKLGWRSYEVIGDSYRGYLAGNDSSIFTFVSYGTALYFLLFSKKRSHKILSSIMLLASIYVMYIIATKAWIVALIITGLISVKLFEHRKKGRLVIYYIIGLLTIAYFINEMNFGDRVYNMYLHQVAQSEKAFMYQNPFPENLSFLNNIAPGRIIIGIAMTQELFSSNVINIAFGFGVDGIYEAFGRPPMMEFFAVLGQFGLFGFLVFYIPQLTFAIRILRRRNYNLANIVFLNVFLYGSLGGFLYGAANTAIMYGLVFAVSYFNYYKPLSNERSPRQL